MIPWTTQEISLLIGLWPNASAAQISKQLNRSRASVCGKAMRLRSDDLLPADVEKHFEVNPAVQTRPGRAQTTVTSIMPAKPTPPVDATVPPPEMRRCSLLELDDGQCRWPLGDVHQVATLFCGGASQVGPIAGIIGGWRAADVSRNPIDAAYISGNGAEFRANQPIEHILKLGIVHHAAHSTSATGPVAHRAHHATPPPSPRRSTRCWPSNPTADLLDIEMAFRAAACASYLVATPRGSRS